MALLKTHLNKLFNLGITPELSLSKKRSIRFTNFAILFGLGFCFLSVVINYLFIGTREGFVPLTFFFLFGLGFHFQSKHQFEKAKVFILALSILGVVFSCWLFGLKGNPYYMFLLTFPAGMVLYPQNKQQINLFLIHVAGLAIALIGSYFISPIMEIPAPFTFALLTFIFSILMLFLIIHTYTRENQIFEDKTNILVTSLTTKNQEIANQKTDLQTINNQLQKEINAKNEVQSQLKESNEQLKRFAYIASHDLKEPLRTIGAFSHLLDSQMANRLDESSLQYLNFIKDGVKRMSNLLDDLLDYSRIENHSHLQKKKINLNEEINNLKANLNDLIKRNEGTVEVIGTLPTIYGFPTQINQLLQNLISNALKFRGAEPPKVQVSCEEQKDQYIFAIKDNGIGIPEPFQNKIFEAFQRLHNKEYEGTGIGLAICRKVVKNHQGEIWLSSEEGKGTIFYFSIAKMPIPLLIDKSAFIITN